jgi:hypothetical protein
MPVERMACPECGTVNAMIAVINDTRQYVCSQCGTVYYTPNSCTTDEKPRTP